MNDPVLRVLAARRAMAEEGYGRSLRLSAGAHGGALLLIVLTAWLAPRPPLIKVVDGFAVPLPRGGGRPRAAEAPRAEEAPPAPAEAKPKAAPEPPRPAPEALVKPVKDVVRKGVAPVDRRTSLREPKERSSREIATEKVTPPSRSNPPTAPTPGAAAANDGLDFTAQTPGVVNGTTGPTGPLGFYLAAAQNRIWANWARQIRPDLAAPVKVAFTIHRDGSIDGIEILQTSGSPTLDRLAERAILTTQLGPLPNAYDKETLVVHANFKPVS